MTNGERQAALERIADDVRVCTRCRLHEQRTRSVPGEGNADTEVVFVGEGPGFNEDREGRPFVGRAGGLLVNLLASIGWQREDVFITNVVKCRPPENRDPQPDEIAACSPYLRRQLEVLDPALIVTLGRYSMGSFLPGARISQAHGTMRPVDPATGASSALAFAMYHPAAALRATEIERTSFQDMAGVPAALLKARELRERPASEPSARFASGTPAAHSPTASDTATRPSDVSAAGRPSDVSAAGRDSSVTVPLAGAGPADPIHAGSEDSVAAPTAETFQTPGPTSGAVLTSTLIGPAERPVPAFTAVVAAAAPDPDPSTDQLTFF